MAQPGARSHRPAAAHGLTPTSACRPASSGMVSRRHCHSLSRQLRMCIQSSSQLAVDVVQVVEILDPVASALGRVRWDSPQLVDLLHPDQVLRATLVARLRYVEDRLEEGPVSLVLHNLLVLDEVEVVL